MATMPMQTPPPQTVAPLGGAGGYDTMMQAIIKQIMDAMDQREQRQRQYDREDRAREWSGGGGLSDVQRANIGAQRTPMDRARQLGSSASVNRQRALRSAGLPTDAGWITPPKPDETESEYIERMRKAQADDNSRKMQVRDKLRAGTQRARDRKAATGQRGSGYVITADTQKVSDPLTPWAPPKRVTKYNAQSMVEEPLARPKVPASTSHSSVDFPGMGSGATPARASGLPTVDAARTAARTAIGSMNTPMSPEERDAMRQGPQFQDETQDPANQDRLRKLLMTAVLGGGMPLGI